MRIIICDDDIIFADKLQKEIGSFFAQRSLALPEFVTYHTGEQLLEDTGSKDLIFLDMELPGIDGILVGRELKAQNPSSIIFVITSFSEYLDDAMRFHVFRYLTKPLEVRRLHRNLLDALDVYSRTSQTVLVETTDDGFFKVAVADIVFLEAHDHMVTIYTTDRAFSSSRPMQYWRGLLPVNCFFQPHRSYLVNMRFVTSFDHCDILLCQGQYKAYLTKRKYTEFKKQYMLYLESQR